MSTLMAGVLSVGAPTVTWAAPAQVDSAAVQLLIQRAAYWKSHGREDLAVKSWQQVLAADPNQPQALAGLGLYAAHNGQLDQARRYLERLKQVSPQDPAVGQMQGLLLLGSGAGPKLAQAARYASEKRYAAAVSVYQNVFKGPPPPKWAITYYQALEKVSGGWKLAISELRTQVKLHPKEDSYRLALGELLTHHAETRTEGIDVLSALASKGGPDAGQARSDWRQALVWMGKDPKATPYLRRYLIRYQDATLHAQLLQAETLRAGIEKQRRRGREIADAYGALRQGNLSLARTRFQQILEREPHNAKAVEGLADIAMREQAFDQAAGYYEQARGMVRTAAERRRLSQAARKARYWSWMRAGQQAIGTGDYQRAVNAYRQALNLEPRDAAALAALGGAYQRLGQNTQANKIFAELTAATPNDPQAWLGALRTLQQLDEPTQVLATAKHIPAGVRTKLRSNLTYAGVMAWAEAASGHRSQAIARLRKAMAQAGEAAPVDLQLQLAWMLYQARDDAALHARLTRLEGRDDLTAGQSGQIRSLYINAAQREAQDAIRNGDMAAANTIVAGLAARYPNDPQVQRVRANLLVQQQRFEEAVAIYKRVGPGSTPGDYAAAVGAALADDDLGQARKWVAAGLRQQPDNVALKSLAARVDLKSGDADAARKTLHSALRSLPQAAASAPAMNQVASANITSQYPFATMTTAASPASQAVASSAALPANRTGVAPDEVAATRSQLSDELAAIDAHMSPYVEGAFFGRSRSGTQGLDQLALFGSQFSGSAAVDYNTRVTVRLAPIAVDAGTISGTAAQQIGTAPIYGSESGDYVKASGLGLAVTLSRPDFGLTLGSTPLGFPVHSLLGKFDWRPAGGPLSLIAFRHSMRDSVLSYAGVKDQKTGQVWGGVFATGVGVSFGIAEPTRRLYGGLSLASVNGKHVKSNSRVEANLGSSWRIVDQRRARVGIGFDLLSMFYANDSSHFTYGQGGYFSPQYYFRPALTVKWEGQLRNRLNYRFDGLVGWQVFHRNSSQYFPLDSAMQAQSGNAYYASDTVGGIGYGLRFSATYAWTPQLFVGGFFGSDNSQDYTNLSGGVILRYWFSPQPIREDQGLGRPLMTQPWLLGLNDPGTAS